MDHLKISKTTNGEESAIADQMVTIASRRWLSLDIGAVVQGILSDWLISVEVTGQAPICYSRLSALIYYYLVISH